MTWFLVFIGGGIGSVCRYGISSIFSQQSQSTFYYPTFVSNMVSCFLAGFLIAALPKYSFTENGRLLLLTGFCGGFSTFSTFSAETMHLFLHQHYFAAIFYTVVSICAGLLFVFLGYNIY